MEETNRNKRKALLLGISALLIFICLCVAAVALSIDIRYRCKEKEAASHAPEYIEEYYYYNRLTYKEQLLFKSLVTAIKGYESDTAILPYRYTEDEFNRTAKAVSFDCPSFFYLDTNSLKLYCDGYKTSVNISYLDTPTSITRMKMEVEAVSAAVMAYIKEDQSDFEKAVILHDFLTRRCSYAGKPENSSTVKKTSHTAYGALADKTAYCDGYASAYKLLLNRCGIEAIIAEGATDVRPHLWNVVKMDGKYYHIDCTWDDADTDYLSDVAFHGYFGLSDKDITTTHEIYDMFALPPCSSDDNYYTLNGSVVPTPEAFEDTAFEQLQKAVKSNYAYIELEPLYTTDEKDYEEALLKAIDRLNGLYDKAVYSRSFRAFKAKDSGNAVTILLYFINQ